MGTKQGLRTLVVSTALLNLSLTKFVVYRKKKKQTIKHSVYKGKQSIEQRGNINQITSSYRLQSSHKWLRKPRDRCRHAVYLRQPSCPRLAEISNKHAVPNNQRKQQSSR